MRWLCAILPWHKIVAIRHVSEQSDWFKCKCGREYAVNYSMRAVLPWDRAMREFYGVHDYPPCASACCHPAHERKTS